MRMIRLTCLLAVVPAFGQTGYDLLLQGGHVVDARNNISAVRDIAIRDGRIAAVAAHVDPAAALKVVNVGGLYVSPGLIDIHVHVYAGTGERGSYAGDNSVYPDGFTFRVGVTTVADAGCAGWRNFEDFKDRVVDRSRTRILAFLNIVGNGMRGARYENDLNDMDPGRAAEMAMKHKDTIIGIKCAHYAGPEWTSVEHDLLTIKLRPGDIYTHCFSGERGVIFDWRRRAVRGAQGFLPDSISTDLHITSMNASMKDMLNVMDKFLAMGMSVDEVIRRATWNPAHEIKREELGNLSVGSVADIAVLRVEKGKFGFTDMYGARMAGEQRLACELTLRNGRVVYDLNGITRPEWDRLPKDYRQTGDARWDAVSPAGRGSGRGANKK